MTRLTNDIKKAITINALKKAGIFAERNLLAAERNLLANDARIAALGGTDNAKKAEHLYKTASALITKLQNTVDKDIYICNAKSIAINAAFGGLRDRLYYGEDSKGEDLRFLTPHKNNCLLPADHELSKRFTLLNEKEALIQKKEDEIKANVKAALNSVSTIKRLIDVWPEAKELIPDDINKTTATLPAVQVEDLNNLIGLPTEK
ncbi:Nmad5 family putative nucleotide modification protein [Morganella morganii]|nr:hypothetical protein [Morganella morganii]